MIGLNDSETIKRHAAGQPIPSPVMTRGVIDTGSDVSVVARRIVAQLGVPSAAFRTTQTVVGAVNVALVKVSLSLFGPVPLSPPMLTRENLIVMELPSPLPNIEVLIGRDVLSQCLLIDDEPGGRFTLAF